MCVKQYCLLVVSSSMSCSQRNLFNFQLKQMIIPQLNTMTQDVTIIMQEVYVKEIQAAKCSLQNNGNHTSATLILKINSADNLSSVHFFKQVCNQAFLWSSGFTMYSGQAVMYHHKLYS
jgi:hypothetical protein